MSKSNFHTTTEPKFQVGFLVFSVFNVSELIRGLTHSRNLKNNADTCKTSFSRLPFRFIFN